MIAPSHTQTHTHIPTYTKCSVPQFFESKMDTIVGHFLGKRSLFTRKVVLGVDGAWVEWEWFGSCGIVYGLGDHRSVGPCCVALLHNARRDWVDPN